MSLRKRGQVTLFIILGIIIFSGVFASIFWVQPTFISQSSVNLNFDSCVNKIITSSIEELAIKGGFSNPSSSVVHKGQEIPYFVYASDYKIDEYSGRGVVQVPFPTQQFEKELYSYSLDGISKCYSNSVSKLQKLGYNVTKGEVDVQISILPKRVRVLINAPTLIESKQFEEITVDVSSEIYGILEMASNIIYKEVAGESQFEVDTMELMRRYPNYIIQIFTKSDSTKVYTIEDRIYKTRYQFASRSNVIPTAGEWEEYINLYE